MASDAITIHVPDDLYSRLERLAGLTKQPLEGLIVKTLSANLPALPDELSPTTRDALQMLEGLSDAEVSQRAQATFSPGSVRAPDSASRAATRGHSDHGGARGA